MKATWLSALSKLQREIGYDVKYSDQHAQERKLRLLAEEQELRDCPAS